MTRIVVIVLVTCCLSRSFGQDCDVRTQLLLPTADKVRHSEFGVTVEVWGDYLVAGASNDHTTELHAGAINVYKLGADNKWRFQAKLTSSISQGSQYLGGRIAIGENII